MLLIVVVLLLCCIMMCVRRRSEKTATYAVDDRQEVLKVDDYPRQLQNPVYGTEEDVVAKDAAAAPTDQVTYSTVIIKKTEEHEFDNPIYGDEITSNVYSHTTHNGNSHGQQPQVDANMTFDDATYSHMPGPDGGANVQGHLYSHTSHNPRTVEPQGASPGAQYDSIEAADSMPRYETPSTAGPHVDIGSRYKQADVELTTDPAPSAAIYSELEEHEYSTLETN